MQGLYGDNMCSPILSYSFLSYPILYPVSMISTYMFFQRWDNHKGAENICKQLGYTGLGRRYSAPGGTGPIQTGNRQCAGGEETIFDCPRQGLPNRGELQDCTHENDQGVECTNNRKKQKTYDQIITNFIQISF